MDQGPYLARLSITACKYLDYRSVLDSEDDNRNSVISDNVFGCVDISIPFMKKDILLQCQAEKEAGRPGNSCVPFSLSGGDSIFLVLNSHTP